MRRILTLVVLAILFPLQAAADDQSDRMKVVNIYAKDLKSRDASVRAEAAEKLGEFAAPEGVPLLITALSDRDASVRRAAASGLWDASEVAQPAIPALRAALNDVEPSVVVRAAGALINMDVEPKEIAEPLRVVLQKGDEVDRFLAARALTGVDTTDKLAGPIIDYVVASAPSTAPKDADLSNRRERYDAGRKALIELGKTDDRSAIPRLMSALNTTPQIVEPLLRALGEIDPRPDKWLETLLAQLSSRDATVRDTAVELLGKQNSKANDVKAWAAVVGKLTTDADKSVRSEAVYSLKNAKGLAYEGLPGMLAAVTSEKDNDIRERAVEGVGEIADAEYPIAGDIKKAMGEKALPVLSAVIKNDPETRIRRTAVRSLDKLELPLETVIPLLARTAIDQKGDVRDGALQALRNRGKEAASAADTIRPLLNDPDERIRLEAKWIVESGQSSYSSRKPITATAATDPAAREKALEYLRENDLNFTEPDFYRSLGEVDAEKVTAFLDAGMSPNLRFASSNGEPVLRVLLDSEEACHSSVRPTAPETKALLKLLLARGADPKIADDNGNTPLMEAAENCDPETVKILLKAGADMNAKNAGGLTAFEFGLYFANDGAAALADAGFRLSAEKVKLYQDGYKDRPKSLALLKKATKAPKTTAAKK